MLTQRHTNTKLYQNSFRCEKLIIVFMCVQPEKFQIKISSTPWHILLCFSVIELYQNLYSSIRKDGKNHCIQTMFAWHHTNTELYQNSSSSIRMGGKIIVFLKPQPEDQAWEKQSSMAGRFSGRPCSLQAGRVRTPSPPLPWGWLRHQSDYYYCLSVSTIT